MDYMDLNILLVCHHYLLPELVSVPHLLRELAQNLVDLQKFLFQQYRFVCFKGNARHTQ